MDLYLDTETFGEEPIKGGAYRYAEKSEVMLVALAVDDASVEVWDTQDRPNWRADLQALVDAADRVIIHNSNFDRTVLAQHGVVIPVEKIEDTMVLALQHGLPGSLGQLCDVLGVPQDEAKDKDGKKLIQLFTKPRPKNMKVRRATRETHPDEWQRFIEYARLDVDATRSIRRRLPRWNATRREVDYWRIDQATNDAGVAVDVELARSALRAFDRASRSLAALTSAETGGVVSATTQRDKLLAYLRETHDFVTHDLTKGTVDLFLRDGSLDPAVRRLLEIRQQAAATSPAKYKALLGAVSADGRLRGTLQFCGAARTGRDAGRIFQPQNLPRTPDWFDERVQEITISALKADCDDLIWSNVSERCSMSVRGCLVAAPGHTFAIADLSNIEGRVLAWGAGEEWKLEAFKAYDRGEGPDLYKVTAGRILGKDPADVTKDERQSMGKVPELACLGPDTRVLTNNGIKAITEVSIDDRLWDGEEWVRHDGLIDRGNRSTIWLAGLETTPDHELLVGQTWLSAATVASCPTFRDHALVTGLGSLPWSAWNSALWAAFERLQWRVLAAQLRTLSTSATYEGARLPAAQPAQKSRPGAGSSGISATLLCARTTRTAVGCATASPPRSTGATILTTARTTITAAVASTCTRLGERIAAFFSRIWYLSKAGTGLSWRWIASMLTGATNPATCASSGAVQTATMCDASETFKPGSNSLRPVYDIANAGPRNRFTVLTDEGALIVHNCGYQGGEGAFRVMGGAKVESMSAEDIWDIVRGWRAAHPRTKGFWYDLERACKLAIQNPGESFSVRDAAAFDVQTDAFGKDWLRMRLPSGRYLCYPEPMVTHEDCPRCEGAGWVPFEYAGEIKELKCPNCGGSGKHGYEEISYMGIDQYTRKWKRLTTYGGKLCIAEDTPVLTERGWVPIQQVSAQDRVWDGVEWVAHAGSVCNGVREVIQAHGVWMTPDHEVLTTEGWRCASQSEGFDRADARVPDGYQLRREQGRQKVHVAGALRLRDREGDGCLGVRETAEARDCGLLRLQAPRDDSEAQDNSRYVEPRGVRGVAQHAGAVHEPKASGLAKLRRAWDFGLRAVGEIFQSFLGGHGTDLLRGSDFGTPGQLAGLRAGQLRVGYLAEAGAQQAHELVGADALGRDDRCGRSRPGGAEPVDGILPDRQRLAGQHGAASTEQRTTAVYDLVNAGPRHRFVVLGEEGLPLIVHNCENWTQATARDVFFNGMQRAYRQGYKLVLRVHDELVAEVPQGGGLTWEGLAECMSTNPSWAAGLPLAAAGFDAVRYRKD